MVTWGQTSVFGTSTTAPSSSTVAAAASTSTPTAPTAGGFSFGGTTSSSTPATTATTTTATNASSSSGGLFGVGTGTGTTATTTGIPNSTPAAAPSLFGGTPTPGPSGNGSLFGGGGGFNSNTPNTTATATTTTTGLFGNTPVAAPSTTNTSFGFGGVGTSTPTGISSFNTVPNTHITNNTTAATTPHQAAIQAHMNATFQQEAARLESHLRSLHSSYCSYVAPTTSSTPTTTTSLFSSAPPPSTIPQQQQQQLPNSLCRFQHIFYDPITDAQRAERAAFTASHATSSTTTIHQQPHAHAQAHVPPTFSYPTRPSHVDPITWSRAIAQNPDPELYIPVVLNGSEALHSRLVAQQSMARTYQSHLQQLSKALQTLKDSRTDATHTMDRGLIPKHLYLKRRLLELMRKIEICRCANLPTQIAEKEWMARLQNMAMQLDILHDAFQQNKGFADEYISKLTLTTMSGGSSGSSGSGSSDSATTTTVNGGQTIEPNPNNVHSVQSKMENQEYCKQVMNVLDKQGEGIEALKQVVKRDARDLDIIKGTHSTQVLGGPSLDHHHSMEHPNVVGVGMGVGMG